MAGLVILEHMHDLSDVALCARWVENPYYQYFCGEESFQHALPFDRSSLTRWRHRLGEEQLSALIQESLSVAHETGALKTKDLGQVAVDAAVQPKNVAFPTDARLLHQAIAILAGLAWEHGVPLRQSYRRVAKRAALMAGRYAHAKQFKRRNREVRFLRTRLGRLIRDIRHKTEDDASLQETFAVPLSRAKQVHRVTKTIRREMKRRAGVEPVIGHVKAEYRMDRNDLKGRDGDRANVVLAAAGCNFSLLIRWFEALLHALRAALFAPWLMPQPA